MTPGPAIPGPAGAALDQLAACRAAVAGLDAREAAHYGELTARAARLAGLVDAISRTLADPARRPAAPPGPGDPAGPPGSPVTGLRDWVERVYRPGYGHLAVLGPCWPQHPLCLYGLDILRQLWTALYHDPDTDSGTDSGLLSARAEYQARILPAIAAQLAAETTRCGHPTVTPYPGARL